MPFPVAMPTAARNAHLRAEGLAGVSVDAPSIRTRNSVFYRFCPAVMGINRVKMCFFVFRYTSDNAISGREWSAHIYPYCYNYLVFIIFEVAEIYYLYASAYE